MSTLTLSAVRQNLSKFDYAGLGLPAMVLLIMAMLVIPLPPLLLDILFTFNIGCSLLVIMIAIGTRKPLEFSSFPSVLLFATMLRLALNVASTRVVLVHGHEGPEAAGKVIAAFGEFVIAGNYLVGFIIFVILMIVNFFVVTKGAGRVSEVNARFTLDAMPGKQMSIDADLNAGVIDQETAKKRREELAQESDFFGANAFALPDGTVVMTDQLVSLLKDNPDAILAVLLHEIGHVEGQHSVRLIAQSLGATLVIGIVFGNPEGVADLLLGSGSVLLQNAFSRDMEREADQFAIAKLTELGKSPQAFADAMSALLAKHSDEADTSSSLLKYLSTHPDTRERIEQASQP